MNNRVEFLKRYVAEIAIGLALMGILFHTLIFVFKFRLLYMFTIIFLQDPFVIGFSDYGLKNMHLLSMLVLIMLATGGLHYKKSGGNDTRLLKFGFSLIAIKSLFEFVGAPLRYQIIKNSASNHTNSDELQTLLLHLILPLCIAAILFFVTYNLTKWLINQQKLNFTIEEIADSKVNYMFEPIPKVTRLIHLVFDMILMFSLLPKTLRIQAKYIIVDDNLLAYNNFLIGFIITLMVIMYYLLFEGLFGATPLKFITGTTVVDVTNMKRPKIVRIIGRSIYRRIPFESFSFLGNKGWHDYLSKTTLIYVKNEGWINFQHAF